MNTPRTHCYVCKLPVNNCICDEEDFEDDGETCEDDLCNALDLEDEIFWKERFAEDDTDGFGRNYSDADPGL
jgi:hypothetical protein